MSFLTALDRDPFTGDFPAANNLDAKRNSDFHSGWRSDDYVPTDITGLQDRLPWLYPFPAERDFLGRYPVQARDLFWLPYVLSALYVVLVLHTGPALMRRYFKKPVECQTALKYWNLFLAGFSFCGALRTVPHLLGLLYLHGWSGTICGAAYVTYGSGASGLWTMLFIHSKYLEFFDTLFLILKNKPVSLLHWYHHASVLLYCWDALMWETPSGIVFVAMNYSVHALMYFYYYLTARRIFPKWGHIVTKLQILQMVVGIASVGSHLWFRRIYKNCDGSDSNLLFAGVIYASYFLLFMQFYFKRYSVWGSLARVFKLGAYSKWVCAATDGNNIPVDGGGTTSSTKKDA